MEGSGQYDYSGSAMDSNTTSLLTCQQLRDLGNPLRLSTAVANALRYIQIIYYMICYPMALLLNVFVIFIITRFKKLHNLTFRLSLQIIIANLANIAVFYPYSTANTIANRDVLAVLCPALGFLTSFLLSARNLLMFVLVADRFCLIFLPFWYSRHRARVVLPLSIVGWTLALMMSIIPVISLRKCYALQRVTWTCNIGRGCDMPHCNTYSIFMVTLINVGTLVAFLLYLALYCKAKKVQNRITVAVLSNESTEAREAAKEARKRDRRSNATFMILFTALLGVTLPAFIFSTFARVLSIVLASRNTTPRPVITIVAVLLTNMFLLIFIMDPIVIMRNQDVREVLQTITAKLRPEDRRGRVGPAGQCNQ